MKERTHTPVPHCQMIASTAITPMSERYNVQSVVTEEVPFVCGS